MEEMDDYQLESNFTYCSNFSDAQINTYLGLRITGILGILLLLLPSLVVQLVFLCCYKSTLLHRQFLWSTIAVMMINAVYIAYLDSIQHECRMQSIVNSLNRYSFYVEMILMTTIHIILLLKLCKYMKTKHLKKLNSLLQTLFSIQPRVWYDVIIVCVQFGIPLPLLIVELVVSKQLRDIIIDWEMVCFIRPILVVNIILGLTCIIMLIVWFVVMIKERLLKNKLRFVCTHMGHIFFVLSVSLIWNTMYLFTIFKYGLIVVDVVRIFSPVSYGVYVCVCILNQRKKQHKTKAIATKHTVPPSTRVSLPTDTAAHALNFLSPSTATPSSEVTPLLSKMGSTQF